MWTINFYIFFSYIILKANTQRCDSGTLIYEDMRCHPLEQDLDGCPTRYDCPNLRTTRPQQCFFKGHAYDVDQFVNPNDTYCHFGCYCTNRTEGLQFRCAQGECINWTPIYAPQDGCYTTFDTNKCCLNGENCPVVGTEVYQCQYGDDTYREGERFFPEDSCAMCVCQKGFRGEIEAPYCVNRKCDVELSYLDKIQDFCAPVYGRREDGEDGIYCCPTSFVCADDQPENVTGESASRYYCEFGQQQIRVGQRFRKEIKEPYTQSLSCECRVPPLLTCIIRR